MRDDRKPVHGGYPNGHPHGDVPEAMDLWELLAPPGASYGEWLGMLAAGLYAHNDEPEKAEAERVLVGYGGMSDN